MLKPRIKMQGEGPGAALGPAGGALFPIISGPSLSETKSLLSWLRDFSVMNNCSF